MRAGLPLSSEACVRTAKESSMAGLSPWPEAQADIDAAVAVLEGAVT